MKKTREQAYADHVRETLVRRKGAGNYVSPEEVALAHKLREQGLSNRAIALETGMNRKTVSKYVTRLSKSDAVRRMHVRLKSEGRPVLPPWAVKRAAFNVSRVQAEAVGQANEGDSKKKEGFASICSLCGHVARPAGWPVHQNEPSRIEDHEDWRDCIGYLRSLVVTLVMQNKKFTLLGESLSAEEMAEIAGTDVDSVRRALVEATPEECVRRFAMSPTR